MFSSQISWELQVGIVCSGQVAGPLFGNGCQQFPLALESPLNYMGQFNSSSGEREADVNFQEGESGLGGWAAGFHHFKKVPPLWRITRRRR